METTNKEEKLSPKDLQRISDIIHKSEVERKLTIYFGSKAQKEEFEKKLLQKGREYIEKYPAYDFAKLEFYLDELMEELKYSEGYYKKSPGECRSVHKYYELLERVYENSPTLDKPRIEQLLETKLIQSNIILKR